MFDSGAVAVGESGVVFGRPNGEHWQPVVEHGPSGNARTLSAVDATDEGARVWFVGESGAIGTYDVAGAVKRDFSNVDDIDADWQAVTVAGRANEETVYLATDEGAVLRLSIVDRSLEIGEFVRPPTLATGLAGLETLRDGRLVVLSRDGRLFVTDDREEWTTVQFQPDEFADVAARSAAGNQKSEISGDVGAAVDAVYAVRAPGEGYRYTGGEPISFPFGQPTLTAVDASPDRVVAVGTDGGVYRRAPDGWVMVTTDNDRTLRDVSVVPGGDGGSAARDVAVGADGTVLERGGIPDGTVDWSTPSTEEAGRQQPQSLLTHSSNFVTLPNGPSAIASLSAR